MLEERPALVKVWSRVSSAVAGEHEQKLWKLHTFVEHPPAFLTFRVADVHSAEDGSGGRLHVKDHSGLWGLLVVQDASRVDRQRF